ncbi:phage terminase large subunit family protein, partial [Neorhizobium galegae]|uniref:phage terminase large subunit family protein n=1 Tax=Neorhizobium galegae TaxID=399 RepID=UPI0021077DFE
MKLPSVNPDANLDSIVIPPAVLEKSTLRFDQLRAERRNSVFDIPPVMSVTEWVHEHIEFKGSISNKKGKLRYLSYQRTLADWFMDENCSEITVLKGTRVGWSIFIASLAMYVAGYLGSSITIAQPTDKDAEAFSKEVIAAMIKCCPFVEAMVIPGSMDIIQLTNGGIIRIIGGTSADNFRRYDSVFNVVDEYSAAGYDNKKGENGDKLTLFKDRGGAHRHTVTGAGSSPLSMDSCRTYARFIVSDQHYPYVVCPHCNLSQIMEWGDKDSSFGFKWQCDEVTGYVTEAWYQCKGQECVANGRKITEAHKMQLDETTEYIATADSEAPGHRGIHVPPWVSSAGQAPFKKNAQRLVSSKGNPEE